MKFFLLENILEGIYSKIFTNFKYYTQIMIIESQGQVGDHHWEWAKIIDNGTICSNNRAKWKFPFCSKMKYNRAKWKKKLF